MHEREILLAALEKARPDEREAYLMQACGTDQNLRGRVDALLRASEVQDSFLEHPAAETELLSRETDGIRREIVGHDELSLDFLQPSDKPDVLGRLGPYEVLEVIGRGGMGVVLRARDTKLDRVVAIKVLAPELASNPTARKRFQREAHAAAAVVHQHIVTIHAVDEDRVPYLVMECIAGQSLKEKIDREGHLKLLEIVRIGQQVASGLAAAHAHGLIHRDVKPANILLENGVERVRITDFGLARAVDDVGMTRTGEVAGTPQYMSPEQAQGLPLDARSDLFSFGCVLYAMCTGRPPFRAETAFATARRVCEDTPRPISEVNPEIPDWLTAIVDRLLAKQPADRFSSAQEAATLLGQHLAHLQQPALMPRPEQALASPRKSTRGWQHWSVVALIALVVVACAFGLTEASGVTKVMPTVIRIVRGEGTLVIEVDDPTVQLSLDGEELSIRGAGLKELNLVPGKYRLHAKKDGQPVKDEVVTITRDGREVVKVTLESSGQAGLSSIAALPISEGMQLAMASEVGWSSEKINALVEVNPDDPSSLLKRCHWHAVRFRWREARADLERVVAMQPGELHLRADLAAICIFLEESEAYTTHCDVLHRQLPGEARPWKVYTAVRSLLLTDSAKFDFPMVRNEVSRRMTPDENATQKRFVPISHYRCGDWQACVDEAEKLSPQGPKSMWDSLHWVYRAMALYRLGRVDEAKSSLAAIKKITEGARGPYWTAKADFQNFFFDGIHVQVVYREASTLILGQRQELNLAPITFPKAQAAGVVLQGQAGLSSVPAVGQPVGELKLLAKLEWHSELVRAVAFLPDGRRVVSVGHDNVVRTWDMANRSVLATLPIPMEGSFSTADVSADGRFVAVLQLADSKGFVRVWDIEKQRVVCEFTPELQGNNCIRFSPDGTRLVTSGNTLPGAVLWDAATGKDLVHFDSGDTFKSMHRAAFSPNGRILALGTDGRVRLFDTESGDVMADVMLPNTVGVVEDVVFALSGKSLATGQRGGFVSLIDIDSRRVIKTLRASDANVRSLRFLGDEQFLLASSYDANLRVWDLKQETVVAWAATGNGANHGLFVAADGRQAITAGGKHWENASGSVKDHGDYALRLWQLPETVWPKDSAHIKSGAFVLLPPAGTAERKFDTLAAAVLGASDGNTIEIRGNGPFETEPIVVERKALTIRAGEGFRPHVRHQPTDPKAFLPVLTTNGPLVLEGLILERAANPGGNATGPAVVRAIGGPVRIAGCRLIGHSSQVGLHLQRISEGVVCNSEILGKNCSWGISLAHPTSTRLRLENNLIVFDGVGFNISFHSKEAFDQFQDAVVLLRHNTIWGRDSLSLGCVTSLDPVKFADPQNAPLRLDAVGNLVAGHVAFGFRVDESIALKDRSPFLPKLMSFRDADNLYDVSSKSFLRLYGDQGKNQFETIEAIKSLKEWHTLCGIAASNSQVGIPGFAGGDVFAKALADPHAVSPIDFRLAPGSPGYQAGPEGKDLGADVDLVGPGAAYERWKKTPEYQVWLKDSGQLRAQVPQSEAGAFVRLGGEGVAELKFDTLAEAVKTASEGDTVEVRGNGPFVCQPIDLRGTALTIRAAEGFRPILQLEPKNAEDTAALLTTDAALVLEGLELRGDHPISFGILRTTASLYAANCRFLSQSEGKPRGQLVLAHNAPRVELRNCEFLGHSFAGAPSVRWNVPPTGRLAMENCCGIDGRALRVSILNHDPKEISIRLARNTWSTKWSTVMLAHARPVTVPTTTDDQKLIHWNTSSSVLDSENSAFNFDVSEEEVTKAGGSPPQAEALLPQIADWQEKQNAYSVSGFLTWSNALNPTGGLIDLAAWNRFWNLSDTGSVEGRARFQGGNLRSRALAALDSVGPDDFRLRPDSPGYRAGKDGKDLGAEVDLVGPGAAYERWRQTPEYQQWLKETGQVKQSPN